MALMLAGIALLGVVTATIAYPHRERDVALPGAILSTPRS